MTLNRLWIQLIQIGGKMGANLFILISGYFLISRENIQTRKVITLWERILFYSMAIFAAFVIIGMKRFEVKQLIEHIAPISFSKWWFASAYFVLYLLSPYINRLLKSFDKRQYNGFLALLLLMWSVMPSITGQGFQSNYLLWFVFLYAIAGYIRLFGFRETWTGGRLIGLGAAGIGLMFALTVVLDFLGTRIAFLGRNATIFYGMKSLPTLIVSILLFAGFSRVNIGSSRFVNVVSSAAFGVYLIHEEPYVRSFLWKTLFRNAAYADSSLLIPHTLFEIAVVFAGCTAIELIRLHVIERGARPLVDRAAAFIDRKIAALMARGGSKE